MFEYFKSEIKLLLIVALVSAVLAVGGVLLWQVLHGTEQPQPLDIVLETRSLEEFTELLHDGQVKRIEYPKQYKDDSLVGSARVTLKNGQVFDSAPITAVLSILERCGSACSDTEVVRW